MTGPANPLDAIYNPNSTLNELAAVAQSHPQLREQIANHPRATPEFRQWVTGLPNAAPPATGPAAVAPMPAGPSPSAAGATGTSRGVGRFLLGVLTGVLVGALVVGALWMTTGSRPGAAAKIEGPGFGSPEEAAIAYVEGLRDKDPDRMMAAYAVESYVAVCDYEGALKRSKFMMPTQQDCKFPADDAAGDRLNVQERHAEVQAMVSRTFSSVVAPSLWNDARAAQFADEEQVERFLEEVRDDFSRHDMAQISDVRAADPADFIDGWDGSALGMDTYLDSALNLTDKPSYPWIVFDVDGDQWAFSPVAAEFDGRWYLITPISPIGWILLDDSAHGGVFKLEG